MRSLEQRVVDGGHEYRSEQGELRVWSPGPNVMATRFRGILTPDFVPAIASYAERRFRAHGILDGFHDWEGMSNYETEARIQLTEWTRAHKTNMRRLYFLVQSKMVAMGLTVANLTLGMYVVAVRERAVFDEALRDVLSAQKRT